MTNIVGTLAVSYTHLDVYKRQFNDCVLENFISLGDSTVIIAVNASNAAEHLILRI